MCAITLQDVIYALYKSDVKAGRLIIQLQQIGIFLQEKNIIIIELLNSCTFYCFHRQGKVLLAFMLFYLLLFATLILLKMAS